MTFKEPPNGPKTLIYAHRDDDTPALVLSQGIVTHMMATYLQSSLLVDFVAVGQPYHILRNPGKWRLNYGR